MYTGRAELVLSQGVKIDDSAMVVRFPSTSIASEIGYFTSFVTEMVYVLFAHCQHVLDVEDYRFTFSKAESRKASITTITPNNRMVARVKQSL